jgi:hypothetical protein
MDECKPLPSALIPVSTGSSLQGLTLVRFSGQAEPLWPLKPYKTTRCISQKVLKLSRDVD